MLKLTMIALCSSIFLTANAACTPTQDAAHARIELRDSAGVEIAENPAAAVAALPHWTIDTASPTVIGADTTADELTSVRGILRRNDGRILVYESRSREVRQYSSFGKLEATIARPGKGPGEIGSLERMQLLPNDSLILFDSSQLRASVFDEGGRFIRQMAYPRISNAARPELLGVLEDGRWLARLDKPFVMPTAVDGPIFRSDFAVVRIEPVSGSKSVSDSMQHPRVDTVALGKGVESYPTTHREGATVTPDTRALLFGKRTVIAAIGNSVFVGIGEQYEIAEYRESKLVRLIRNGSRPEEVTQEVRTRSEADIAALYDASRMPEAIKAQAKAELKMSRYAATYPFYGRLVAGDDSTLWVEDEYIGENDGRRYLVYDRSGRALAHVAFPDRARGFVFSRSSVVGTILDENDVPRVAIWKLVPDGRP